VHVLSRNLRGETEQDHENLSMSGFETGIWIWNPSNTM